MAILSESEFEAVLGNALMRIDKELVIKGDVPPLKEARRELEIVLAAARDKQKLKALLGSLSDTCDVIRAQIPDDTAFAESLWDLVDYVDYRC